MAGIWQMLTHGALGADRSPQEAASSPWANPEPVQIQTASGKIVRTILQQYTLPWLGVHGVTHWGRVLENGLRLADLTGANKRVVELFAIFHDARRASEGTDFDHGRLAADYARLVRGKLFKLSDDDFDLLHRACSEHTDGLTEADVTVQTCWDADRLDLGRVGIRPDPRYLCTEAAKDAQVIAWAWRRSRRRTVPAFVRQCWLNDMMLCEGVGR